MVVCTSQPLYYTSAWLCVVYSSHYLFPKAMDNQLEKYSTMPLGSVDFKLCLSGIGVGHGSLVCPPPHAYERCEVQWAHIFHWGGGGGGGGGW